MAMAASGCPLAAKADQYCKPLVMVGIGGAFNHSLIASPADAALSASKLSKYLFREVDTWNKVSSAQAARSNI
jgi:hypothetical protein